MPSPVRETSLPVLVIALAADCTNIPGSGTPVSQLSSLDCEQIEDRSQHAKATQANTAQAKRTSRQTAIPIAIGSRHPRAYRLGKSQGHRAMLLEQQYQ